MMEFTIIDRVLGLFGQGRTTLGSWPHREVVNAALATLTDLGAEKVHEDGTPAGEVENFYFRIDGKRVRLSVTDYGDVTLWGPNRLVTKICKEVTARLKK